MDQRKNSTRNTYSAIANLYANDYSRDFSHFEYVDSVLVGLENSAISGLPIVDLGSGHGRVPEYILDKEQKYSISAVDISPDFCKMMQNKFSSGKVNVVESDMTQFLQTLENESVAAVTANFSVIHIPQEEVVRLFESVHRVLHPKGLFFLSVHKGTFKGMMEEYYQSENDPRLKNPSKLESYMNFFSEEEIRILLSDAGFSIEKMDTFPAVQKLEKNHTDDIYLLAAKQSL